MTYGGQNSQEQAFKQLDYATEHGINFLDTAEMYSIPTSPKTYGETECIIGSWLETRKNRNGIILATKVTGPSRIKHIRGGKARLDQNNINEAINGSLKRLKTDYIDLYQLHWPDRKTNFFGTLAYQHETGFIETPIEETLYALAELVKSGKIRAIGISNETAWGAMKFIQLAEQLKLPRIISIQNPYNLLNRSFELGLAEIAHREQVGLLAYSPLAFGALTGKYINAQPANARCSLYKEYKRYFTPSSIRAVEKYAELAKKFNISMTQMALAFVNQQSFLTSTIIGATNLAQLSENIQSEDLLLNDDLFNEIEKIHAQHTYPSP
jgi:aryl-alcohol dehydrogenase-like predicted oxidoreductase